MTINVFFYSYWMNNIYNRSKFIAFNSTAANGKTLEPKSWKVIVTYFQLPLRRMPVY